MKQIRGETSMSVKIPRDIQEFLTGEVGWVATAARDGTPNVSLSRAVPAAESRSRRRERPGVAA